MHISFVLFDEIEKASDALWNLLLGILDKATLTLGDNRRVDFSQVMIFMTSNLGASQIESLLSPKLGFARMVQPQNGTATGRPDDKLNRKITRCGIDAARRKFTPEFMNRLDKIVVFRTLGVEELRKVLDIELTFIQRRVFRASGENCFVFTATPAAKQFLLDQGTDMKYGARHLKRAIERLLVQPMSNLIATDQVRGGDCIEVDFEAGDGRLSFIQRDQSLTFQAMAELVHSDLREPLLNMVAVTEQSKRSTSARSSR